MEFFGVVSLCTIQQRAAKLSVCLCSRSIGFFPFPQALLKVVCSVRHTSDVNRLPVGNSTRALSVRTFRTLPAILKLSVAPELLNNAAAKLGAAMDLRGVSATDQ